MSFNYIIQDQLDQALKIINETENILSRLTEHSTDFLNSIKCAMYHITLTTKGYVLTKYRLSTEVSISIYVYAFMVIILY